jgi:hypothetical protein
MPHHRATGEVCPTAAAAAAAATVRAAAKTRKQGLQ